MAIKVLLIDDEQAILDTFGAILQKAGYELTTAMNGKDALDKGSIVRPDVILMDEILPDMNGNQILQLFKKKDETKSIPVAILSNYSQDNLMQEAIKLGASDYILKYQIEPADLVNKVKQIIQEQGKGEKTIIQSPR